MSEQRKTPPGSVPGGGSAVRRLDLDTGLEHSTPTAQDTERARRWLKAAAHRWSYRGPLIDHDGPLRDLTEALADPLLEDTLRWFADRARARREQRRAIEAHLIDEWLRETLPPTRVLGAPIARPAEGACRVATVEVDLSRKAMWLKDDRGHVLSSWAPGVTTRAAAELLEDTGWELDPDDVWRHTSPPDGFEHRVRRSGDTGQTNYNATC